MKQKVVDLDERLRRGLSSDRVRPIPDLDGYYVSRIGEVFSTRNGVKRCRFAAHRLRPHTSRGGYLRFLVYFDGGSRRCVYVHQVVLLAFVGPKPKGMDGALHKDGNKLRNCVSNLYWGTTSDNQTDSVRHGHHRSQILNERWVLAMRRENASKKITRAELGKKYGVTGRHVVGILSGRKWKFVGGPLDDKTRAHSFGKLTEGDVLAVRQRMAEDPNLYDSDLATEYGVHKVTIGQIRTGKLWARVGGPRSFRKRGAK